MTVQNTPFRQIRAHYTSTTIVVYQAYNSEIAKAAVEHQKLNASSKFSTTRMTWIKPSWAWMLYRSGYSYKDPGQECILALTMTRSAFISLLHKAIVSTHDGNAPGSGTKANKESPNEPAHVRVQWDPERTVRLGKLAYRSIQIGIPGALVDEMVEGIIGIEDVTLRARRLKAVLAEQDSVDMEQLMVQGLVPKEDVFEVNEELRGILRMDET
jgi:hypothetical protein